MTRQIRFLDPRERVTWRSTDGTDRGLAARDAECRESATLRDAEVWVRIDERTIFKTSPIPGPAEVNATTSVENAALEPAVRSAPTWSSASATVWATG